MNRTSAVLISLLYLVACSNRPPAQHTGGDTAFAVAIHQSATLPDTFSKATLFPHITCLSDASQSYTLYIPATLKTTLLPILFCFDPHGDGALPLMQYKAPADEFGFILVGSNNAKNGNDGATTKAILNTLFTDVQSRLLFNHNRMYACGFSGGAKVAGYAALQQSGIKGVITAGAGLPDRETLRSFPFSITALAGRGDMNLTDLIAMDAALDETSTVHRLILFDGKHAWPPAETMHTAFAALQFDAMRDRTTGRSNVLITGYEIKAKNNIKSEEDAGEWLAAGQTCALAANLLMNLTNITWFTNEQIIIKRQTAYAQQQQQSTQLLAQEEQTKQAFQQQFGNDVAYWQTTVASLQQKAKGTTPEAAMYQRLLAYLSLAFYSLSNRFITNNQNEAAQHFVALYKLADATNAEAWYLSAVLNARNDSAAAVENDLKQAVSLGFTDTVRLRGQPEFAVLLPPGELEMIEKKIK